jgi:Rps23 Pro-64 3,4-dihydroxylase Tpa1-like proline 4-hydroxylase
LISEENLNLMSEISGSKYTSTDEVFAACYLPGDFLSPHIDSPNGTLGFVYQLTKNWLPQYGGLLHFMDDEKEVIERVEIPTFNTLTLFYLPPGKGKWHFVSHVAPGVPELRLSYTGWFK